jgi:tRNA(Ile)-lysidine synthase
MTGAKMTDVSREARDRLAETVRASGLLDPTSRGVALLSGGPDSGCLAAGLTGAVGADSVVGLHVNYGLRSDSGEDEAACRALCEGFGIELVVERPELESGNLQASAREARYEAAERLRAERGAEWVATGHTRTDLAETVLYRLAVSPGRRALLGLAPRHGRVVRPLLAIGREETRRLAVGAGLPFHDDPSNEDPRFARVRLRRDVLPVLRELSPAAEENIAATWSELAEEADALEALAVELTGGELEALQASTLAEAHPALARLALRALAERAAGHPVALSREAAAAIVRLSQRPEGGEVDLGEGRRAVCEAGTVRVRAAAGPTPEPARLRVPGSCRFGHWRVRVELAEVGEPRGPDVATLDPAALGAELCVRAWHEGDRMRPLGLGGAKSLQDLFTDRRVPRSLRRELPVVLAGGRIAWVPGVAVSEEFRLAEGAREAAVLTASRLD